ncbi:RHS repeat-associated core domain-containing protein [Pseudomonas monteilii]|uniref:RHS repeat-associated core domain-containing protein n=1 Tax=Pseudomonas monteilii TaxID=76759 RepID=UPI00383A92D8
MEKQSVGKRFYQGQQLVTQVQGPNFSQTLLFAGGRCLSERQSAGNPVNPGLVATEFKGSVIDVVHGNDVTRHTYTSYGYSPAVSAKFPRPGFNGALLELVTGCYMLGNGTRGYDPRIMRFTSPDRLSPFLKGGINSYAYCEGDPVNYTDPTGQGKIRSGSSSFDAKAKQFEAKAKHATLRAKTRRRLSEQRLIKRVRLLDHEKSSPQVKGDILIAQDMHESTFDRVGLPPEYPGREQARQSVARAMDNIYLDAIGSEVAARYTATIGGSFIEGRHRDELSRRAFLAENEGARVRASERSIRSYTPERQAEDVVFPRGAE